MIAKIRYTPTYKENLKIETLILLFHYAETQWAAVNMNRLEMTDPPQNGPSNPGSSTSVLLPLINAAIQGQLAIFALAPLVILFWNTNEDETGELPHSVIKNQIYYFFLIYSIISFNKIKFTIINDLDPSYH